MTSASLEQRQALGAVFESDNAVGQKIQRFTTPLARLGLEVFTGRVVDFGAKQFLVREAKDDTAPLICGTSEANAPGWIDAFSASENFGQTHFQMLARPGVYEHETKLLFQALRDKHFSRSQREEVAREV